MNGFLLAVRVSAIAGACLLLVGCAGARGRITATRIEQPVSFTACVFDGDGKVVTVGQEDTLKHFKLKKRFWAVMWRCIGLNKKTWDISDALKDEISKANGDAVVNLTVASNGDWWWWLSSLLPIIPDYHTVVVEGDVARVRAGEAK